MDGRNRIEQVRIGMLVLSSDGTCLGKVTQVHTRDEIETYLEVTPRRNLWKPWQLEVQRFFLPGSTVTRRRSEARAGRDGCHDRQGLYLATSLDSA